VYIWQQPGWPGLSWKPEQLSALLAGVSRAQGRLLGRMEALGFELRSEAHLRTLTEDVVKSSEIEGERLAPEQVRSSLARHLGMDAGGLGTIDRNVEGIVEVMLDATGNHRQPLVAERLFAWHAALFPTGQTGMRRIVVGDWRDDARGPMRVVSGPIGREKVHYEAPPAARVPVEMQKFLEWFAAPGDADPLLVAGLAHLWFVTIHPFDDGNGRIARAIADMALARAENVGQRFYSMSAQIRAERDRYYDMLESTQKDALDVTRWQEWFLGCLQRAIHGAGETLAVVLGRARFWERHPPGSLNERQVKILNRLLDGSFEGKLTSSKWAKMARTSQDTANRDIAALIGLGVLVKDPAGGRSTSYSLAPDDATAVG
jgi:Fic family protein